MTVTPAFVFLRQDSESNNDALARCAEEVLAPGPMADTLRGDDYQWFLDDTFGNGKQLRHKATSCAVFVGGCSIAASVQKKRGWPRINGITTWAGYGWFGSKSWIAAKKLAALGGVMRGDVLYWCGGNAITWQAAFNGHVGIARTGSGMLWTTAEGGGSPGGTCCRLSEPKDISESWKRPLRGVWRPNLLVSA